MVNMFGNIAFLNEGEQAEEYKRKKAEETAKKEKEEEERVNRRFGNHGFRDGGGRKGIEDRYNMGTETEHDIEDNHRFINANKAVVRDDYKRAANWKNTPMRYTKADWHYSQDAIDKHMRRHPEQWDGNKYIGLRKESSIFESVTFLNDSSFEDIKKQREQFQRNHDDRMKSVKDASDSFNKTREDDNVKSDNEEELNSISAKLKALKQ